MKERYSYELPLWMKLLGIWRVNQDSIDTKWGHFAPRFSLQFVVSRGGYFDQRYALTLAFIWGVFHFYLPFKTKLKEGCNTPRYGFAIHDNIFWIYTGGKYDESMGQCTGNDQWITWDLPFFSYIFDGHWIRDKINFSWIEVKNNSYELRKTQAYIETHPFQYILKNGTVQNRMATCSIEKRKWHRKWFPFFTKVSEVIDIDFNDEVGERSGTWKGGVISCCYKLLPGETIGECLKRMEKERNL
jgi:hypothetical protein